MASERGTALPASRRRRIVASMKPTGKNKAAPRPAPRRSGARPKSEEEFLPALGMTRAQALERRARLQAFEEDWDAPGMELYDEPAPRAARAKR